MKISRFGKKIARGSGIRGLMEDLGNALAERKDVLMLGGGNPAHINEVEKHFRQSIRKILETAGNFERTIGDYDPPQGNKTFIAALASLLRDRLGWPVGVENIALTNGSQSAFFALFNIFAGPFEGGSFKKILLPLAPEYIGYSDVGLSDELFITFEPDIEHLDDHIFKYHINFDRLRITNEIGAVCVSRPTNPTGNVISDSELEKLSELARTHDVPLIIDNAYGPPFPNIIFTKAEPLWNEGTIVCMSLSKLGLPAVRTGIVIADEEIIKLISEMNAVMSLAPGSLGPAIATELVRTGQIIRLSRDVIRPFYQKKADRVVEQLLQELNGVDFHIHKPEGAFFLWLWFRDLPISDIELYERLKRRGVLVVPGRYFFPGHNRPWQHKNECIRLNYAPDDEIVSAGIKIIAEEVKRAYVVG